VKSYRFCTALHESVREVVVAAPVSSAPGAAKPSRWSREHADVKFPRIFRRTRGGIESFSMRHAGGVRTWFAGGVRTWFAGGLRT
jgi:hypothetical protein